MATTERSMAQPNLDHSPTKQPVESKSRREEHEREKREKKHDNPGINSKLAAGDVDGQLDKALMDSFPASDPPAASQPSKDGPAGDPKVQP